MTEPGTADDVVRSGEKTWRALPVAGASVKVLRADKDTGESTSLVRFAAGTRFPAHNHPGGEEVFVLEGDLQIGRDRLKAGDYLYTPPNGVHAASSKHGCVFLVTLPKPVEILTD
jgi:quercetin dioxygenase-like cupin family protein